MNTIYKFIFVALCVTFFSCNKDENLSTGASSITSDGVLSGKIVDFVPNSIDSVKVLGSGNIGARKVLSSGDFTIGLSVPQLSRSGNLSGVTLSDINAMTGSVSINTYLNNNFNGSIRKCNFDSLYINKAGMSYSMFVYSDRDFTMKGTHIETGIRVDRTEKFTANYQVALKKGWNELVTKVDLYTLTSNSLIQTQTVTNIITPDLQWHFVKYDNSAVHEELNGKVQVKWNMLF